MRHISGSLTSLMASRTFNPPAPPVIRDAFAQDETEPAPVAGGVRRGDDVATSRTRHQCTGDFVHQPPGIAHRVVTVSPDCELLQATAPADYETAAASPS